MTDDLIFRLRERARIRRLIPGRKSVQQGETDRIADLLDEAATALSKQHRRITLINIVIMAANLLAAIIADMMHEMGGATSPAVYAIIVLNLGGLFLLPQRKAVP